MLLTKESTAYLQTSAEHGHPQRDGVRKGPDGGVRTLSIAPKGAA